MSTKIITICLIYIVAMILHTVLMFKEIRKDLKNIKKEGVNNAKNLNK